MIQDDYSGAKTPMKWVICDLDGTLTDDKHRRHFIEGKGKPDWDSFNRAARHDTPQQEIIELVRYLDNMYHIAIFTGRSAEVWDDTVTWLQAHRVPWEMLVMRDKADYRFNHEVKAEWLKEHIEKRGRKVAFVLDDQDATVKWWRSQGIKCLQVADGGFDEVAYVAQHGWPGQ